MHSLYVPDVLPTMLLNGAGVGLWFMPSVSIAMSDVEPTESRRWGCSTRRSMGASIGVAVLATVSATRTMTLLAERIPVAEALTAGYRLAFVVAVGCSTASLVAACSLLPSRPRQGTGSAVEGRAGAPSLNRVRRAERRVILGRLCSSVGYRSCRGCAGPESGNKVPPLRC